MVGFYLTCSRQQLVVPQGIRGRLILRLSAPVIFGPQTNRYLQVYHNQLARAGG
jgi:hypothetical protein